MWLIFLTFPMSWLSHTAIIIWAVHILPANPYPFSMHSQAKVLLFPPPPLDLAMLSFETLFRIIILGKIFWIGGNVLLFMWQMFTKSLFFYFIS